MYLDYFSTYPASTEPDLEVHNLTFSLDNKAALNQTFEVGSLSPKLAPDVAEPIRNPQSGFFENPQLSLSPSKRRRRRQRSREVDEVGGRRRRRDDEEAAVVPGGGRRRRGGGGEAGRSAARFCLDSSKLEAIEALGSSPLQSSALNSSGLELRYGG